MDQIPPNIADLLNEIGVHNQSGPFARDLARVIEQEGIIQWHTDWDSMIEPYLDDGEERAAFLLEMHAQTKDEDGSPSYPEDFSDAPSLGEFLSKP